MCCGLTAGADVILGAWMEAVAAGGSGAVWVEELALWVVVVRCWFSAAEISGGCCRLRVACQWFRAVGHGALYKYMYCYITATNIFRRLREFILNS